MKNFRRAVSMAAAVLMSLTAVTAQAYAAADSQTVYECRELKAGEIDISNGVVNIMDQEYTGKPIEPLKYSFSMDIGDDWYSLSSKYDYTVTYQQNTDVGVATAIIKGKGDYTGTINVKFRIVPKAPTNFKVVSKNGKLSFSWKKVSNAKKYSIFYSENGSSVKPLVAMIPNKITSYTTSELDTKNNSYSFYVKTFDHKLGEDLYSKESNIVSIDRSAKNDLDKITLKRTFKGNDKGTMTAVLKGFDLDAYMSKVKSGRLRIEFGEETAWMPLGYDITFKNKKITSCEYFSAWVINHKDPVCKWNKSNKTLTITMECENQGLYLDGKKLRITVDNGKNDSDEGYIRYLCVANGKSEFGDWAYAAMKVK